MKKVRKYSGQAIAIIMVVLVVATVIGASLYSRILRNRDTLIETKESARALEQADTILDLLITSDLVEVQNILATCLSSGTCEYENLEAFRNAFSGLIEGSYYTKITDWCDLSQDNSGTSSLKVVASYAEIGDYQQFDVGKVMAIKVGGPVYPANCELTLGFASFSPEHEIFTIKRVYANTTNGTVKPYEESDMLLYCFAEEGGCSSSNLNPSSSLVRTFTAGDNEITIPLNETILGYPLYEIRVIPLRGTLGVSVGVPECAGNILKNYKVNAQVNCKGDYREKQVIIPNVNNLGYPLLFDYTIYNATGVLRPN